MLRNMIVEGTARPGKIVSHRVPISQATEAFAQFDQRASGHIKVALDLRR
jgi:threonine dehydrogenase-like Zn-dependent dehydrogenase